MGPGSHVGFRISGRGPSSEHFWQVWLKSVQRFQRRRFKCEKLTDGRTLTHDKSSHDLWPGELIIPLLHIMLNFVGQHHTSWILFIHLEIIMAIFKECMHCVNTPFHIFFSLQMKCQILTFINYCWQFEKDSYFRKQRKNNYVRGFFL